MIRLALLTSLVLTMAVIGFGVFEPVIIVGTASAIVPIFGGQP